MKPNFLLALAFTQLSLGAAMSSTHFSFPFTCPTVTSDFSHHESRVLALERARTKALPRANAKATIPTYVHVISRSRNPSEGNIPYKDIQAMISELNSRFAPYGFAFSLINMEILISEIDSDKQNPGFAQDRIDSLRKGSYDALNIYTFTQLYPRSQGTCSYAGTPLSQDGCSIRFDVLPPLSSSEVLVHEIGHWLGLRHTFVNKTCTEDDFDSIEDTPKHLNPQELPDKRHEFLECLPISSCGGQDPIFNYMNYMSRKCMREFTSGQVTRMQEWWDYRVKQAKGEVPGS